MPVKFSVNGIAMGISKQPVSYFRNPLLLTWKYKDLTARNPAMYHRLDVHQYFFVLFPWQARIIFGHDNRSRWKLIGRDRRGEEESIGIANS